MLQWSDERISNPPCLSHVISELYDSDCANVHHWFHNNQGTSHFRVAGILYGNTVIYDNDQNKYMFVSLCGCMVHTLAHHIYIYIDRVSQEKIYRNYLLID